MNIKKKYILLLTHVFLFSIINAQYSKNDNSKSFLVQDTIDDEEEPDTITFIPDDFDSTLDYLLYTWAIDKNSTTECYEQSNPEVTENQYRERLKKLPHLIEMPFNATVKSFIEVYVKDRRKQVEYMAGLGKYYYPIFEEELNAAKLPLELKFLPVIESALIPTAVSRVGAGGLWQFMISTGRMYDLEINSLVDERFDPQKSTKAAVKYLKDLHSIYGDWNLAIAAYNCGPGNVNKAIRRAGGKRDFWEIYPYLPRETRGYVPIFVAANYVMTYYKEHNLCPAKVLIATKTDTVITNKRIYFEQISTILNLPIEQLRLLNPQYKKDIVPGDIKPYPICLPINYINQFIDKQTDIISYKSDILNSRREEITQVYTPQVPNRSERVSKKNKSQDEFIHLTVSRGQTLGGIAKKYKVTVAQIKKWNNLKKSEIKKGQKLKIRKK